MPATEFEPIERLTPLQVCWSKPAIARGEADTEIVFEVTLTPQELVTTTEIVLVPDEE